VDGALEVGGSKAAASRGKISLVIDGIEFQFVQPLLIGNMRLDVLVEIPTGVFIDNHEQRDELAVNAKRTAVRLRLSAGVDDNGPDQAAFERGIAVRVI